MNEENPKAAMGRQKIDFSAVPAIAQLYIAAAMNFDAIKYGRHNWREKPIRLRDYLCPN
ncbi:dATP/dGTP diphosphohydrolase domain-containing protein [Microvirga sp. G4-2]|uniref:dATP/dGTP diphosphohydrolase domain-containing protein n=1 Tax=Microvirga sp. G4-2 TaxID=3434467 RepID=UPI004043FCB5